MQLQGYRVYVYLTFKTCKWFSVVLVSFCIPSILVLCFFFFTSLQHLALPVSSFCPVLQVCSEISWFQFFYYSDDCWY